MHTTLLALLLCANIRESINMLFVDTKKQYCGILIKLHLKVAAIAIEFKEAKHGLPNEKT